jgi:hypothetical protein
MNNRPIGVRSSKTSSQPIDMDNNTTTGVSKEHTILLPPSESIKAKEVKLSFN